MKQSKIALALMLAGVAQIGFAADADRIVELEKQLKALQGQLTELHDQVSAQTKENVVVGDVPNSFRIPGSDVSTRLYGVAELNLVHETRGDNSNNDYSTFMPYMPLNGSAAANRSGQTYMHARTSRIGIEGATPSSFGQISAKIEGDFNNDPRTGNSAVYGDLKNIYTQQATNSYNFRLRHAYVQAGAWTIGQTWSTFMDVDNTPESVDFNGAVGSTFIRQPQIRYTYRTPESGNFSAAIENSVSYVLDSTGSATTAGFSKVPDLIGRWDKGYNWGSLSLRGVSHELRLNDGAGVKTSRRGWGLSASGLLKAVGDDYLTWIVTGGKGIGRYFNYVEGAGYDSTSKKIVLEKAVGVVVGYQHKFNDSYRANVSVGVQRNYDNEYTTWSRANGLDSGQYGTNRYVGQAHIGGFWNPVKVMEVGAEYIFGQRQTLAGERGQMSRVNFLTRYSFN